MTKKVETKVVKVKSVKKTIPVMKEKEEEILQEEVIVSKVKKTPKVKEVIPEVISKVKEEPKPKAKVKVKKETVLSPAEEKVSITPPVKEILPPTIPKKTPVKMVKPIPEPLPLTKQQKFVNKLTEMRAGFEKNLKRKK